MSTKSVHRISPVKLAGLGAVAAATLGVASPALAATTGGAPMTQAAVQAKSAPFTIGFSDLTVKPGQKLTISGLAYARAGKNLTILSNALESGQSVNGVPSVQTPALVEGIYQTTVRVSPAAKPGVYPVLLRFGNRQVASTDTLRVVSPTSPGGRSVQTRGCAGIGFSVLHNDRAGNASLPAGGYTVSSPNLACGTASSDFAGFLARAGRTLPGWTSSSATAGRATFTQTSSGLSFSVAKQR
ncbi:MAG TPA: hypothetical protein VGL69_12140 [Solirubrobacteraceae bacterium]|jgi:hypothetical protein